MKFNLLAIIALFISVLSFTSCTEDDEPKTLAAGEVSIEFDHVFGPNQLPFNLNTEYTHQRLGEKMTFSMFRYYVSNVRLKKTDGSWYTVPESYYIVDLGVNDGTHLHLENIPGGEYTDIEMMFGVDSLRNVSGAQTGALDPAKGMFWSWNSGYIMLKTEGTSPSSSDGSFAFHLGGFKGANAVPTVKSYSLGKLVVDGDREAEIHMVANPARLWHEADGLAVRSKTHMPGAVAKQMTGTFYDGIVFDHIHN